jgi:hypothetical protein
MNSPSAAKILRNNFLRGDVDSSIDFRFFCLSACVAADAGPVMRAPAMSNATLSISRASASAARVVVAADRLGRTAPPGGGSKPLAQADRDASCGCEAAIHARNALPKLKLYSKLRHNSQLAHFGRPSAARDAVSSRVQHCAAIHSLQFQAISAQAARSVQRFGKQTAACLDALAIHVARHRNALVGCCAPHGRGTPKILLWAGLFGPVAPTTYEHRA